MGPPGVSCTTASSGATLGTVAGDRKPSVAKAAQPAEWNVRIRTIPAPVAISATMRVRAEAKLEGETSAVGILVVGISAAETSAATRAEEGVISKGKHPELANLRGACHLIEFECDRSDVSVLQQAGIVG